MLRRIRRSHHAVVAYLALFFALGGTSYALVVNGALVQDESLTGADVRNSSLTGDDVVESSLGQVPSAASADSATTAGHATSADSAATAGHATSADSAATAGHATTAGDADTLDQLDSSAFARAGSSYTRQESDGRYQLGAGATHTASAVVDAQRSQRLIVASFYEVWGFCDPRDGAQLAIRNADRDDRAMTVIRDVASATDAAVDGPHAVAPKQFLSLGAAGSPARGIFALSLADGSSAIVTGFERNIPLNGCQFWATASSAPR